MQGLTNAPTRAATTVVFALLIGTTIGASPLPESADGVSADAGARIFLGQDPFQNGGPPCGACHRLSALAFPNGGTVGPDLSAAYQTLGEAGVDVTLQTLFFPTMMPLYEKRPLTPSEQQALKAVLKRAAPSAASGSDTRPLGVIAALGFLVLMAVAWLAWRRRVRAVRAALVREAMAGDVRP